MNDSAHFNALGAAMAHDLDDAVEYVRAHAFASGVVLQAAGPHFCIGAYPYSKHDARASLVPIAGGVFAIARSCSKLRDLSGAVVAAVHGHLVGGGIALCLAARYMCVDTIAT